MNVTFSPRFQLLYSDQNSDTYMVLLRIYALIIENVWIYKILHDDA